MLNLRSNIQLPSYAPDDLGGGAPGNLNNADDILTFLKDGDSDSGNDDNEDGTIELDETKKPIKGKKPETDEEDESEKKDSDDGDDDEEIEKDTDELDDLEEELKEFKDEDLELVTPVRRAEILKKYPKLFKDFPYLEKAYYREQKYTELLPTIQDAQSAVESVKVLAKFERELLSGDSSEILKTIKTNDPNAFKRVVDNYLPNLAKVDAEAHSHIVGNVAKNIIMHMVREAKASNNDVLQNTASILNQFLFGSSTYTPPQKLAVEEPKDDPKHKELEAKEREFEEKRFTTVRDTLSTRVENTLKNTIANHIDPKGSMTEYVKKNASREALERIQTLLEGDSRFKSVLDKFWERAYKNNYSEATIAQIKDAVLSRAKTLLPTVLKQARNEALRGIGKRIRETETDETDDTTERTNAPKKEGRSTSSSNSGRENNNRRTVNKIPAGMSTKEFLMQD